MIISRNEPVKIKNGHYAGEVGSIILARPWQNPIKFIVKTENHKIVVSLNDLEFLDNDDSGDEIGFDNYLLHCSYDCCFDDYKFNCTK